MKVFWEYCYRVITLDKLGEVDSINSAGLKIIKMQKRSYWQPLSLSV